jgi:hypothetical protein
MRAATVVLLVLSKARLSSFISLNRQTTDRPLQASQTSRAAPSSYIGTKNSNAAPTRSVPLVSRMSGLDLRSDPRIPADTPDKTQRLPRPSNAAAFPCFFVLLVGFAFGVGRDTSVDSMQFGREYGSYGWCLWFYRIPP